MGKTKYDYEEELSIDPSALDVELLIQPNLFLKWSRLYRRAERKVRQAEEKVKVMRSKLINKGIARPGLVSKKIKASGKVPTGPQLEAYYRTHPDHLAAKDELDRAMYERDILYDAVTAFRQRKDVLRDMVQLCNQEYFATPSVPRDLRRELDKRMERRVDRKTKVRRKRK